MAKRQSLRETAMKAPSTILKRLTWMEKLDDETRKEFIEFVLEWHAGGELSERYPTRRSLIRFIQTQPFASKQSRTSLDNVVVDIIEESCLG